MCALQKSVFGVLFIQREVGKEDSDPLKLCISGICRLLEHAEPYRPVSDPINH